MKWEQNERPRVAAEVRAWALAAIVFIGQAFGITWWAATLSADFRNLQGQIAELKESLRGGYSATEARRDLSALQAQLNDHEQRIRVVEVRRP